MICDSNTVVHGLPPIFMALLISLTFAMHRKHHKPYNISKAGFHEPIPRANERHKLADQWNFEKIFGRCNRFVKLADLYY